MKIQLFVKFHIFQSENKNFWIFQLNWFSLWYLECWFELQLTEKPSEFSTIQGITNKKLYYNQKYNCNLQKFQMCCFRAIKKLMERYHFYVDQVVNIALFIIELFQIVTDVSFA
eukprot:TRINITY_DN25826_c0_g1_i1.p5 TRINITY_DN25826_c0_g1~~TRINITY_DN25826_c0_g1_i1.p5  ORF type:complete len:114 (-),score=1.01 TRINITY_DN25826_c0_g1_i1:167-508(-)